MIIRIIKGVLSIKKILKARKELSILSEVLGTGTEFMAISEAEKGTITNIFDHLKKGGRGMTIAKRESIGREMLVDTFYDPKGSQNFLKEYAKDKFQAAAKKFDVSSNLRGKIEDIIKDFDLKDKSKKFINKELNKLKNKVDPRKNKYMLKIQKSISIDNKE